MFHVKHQSKRKQMFHVKHYKVIKMNSDFMLEAIKQAEKAYKNEEVPVGAVIVKNNKIIAKAHNQIESKKDSTKHAELIAIQKASKKNRNWRLNDCDLYVTLEPCNMCRSAIELSRINNVYYCLSKNKDISIKENKYKKTNYYEEKYKNILQSFFKKRR